MYKRQSIITKNVESKSISLNGDNTGMIAVYDSLLICWSPDYPNHFFNIFNVDTGEEIGSFCRKGLGNKEAISVNCIFQFFKKGDDIMTLLYASNEGRLFFWNISQSVEKKQRYMTQLFRIIIIASSFSFINPKIYCLPINLLKI